MKDVYVFLAEGFEEIEGLTVVDLLRRAGIESHMVSITDDKKVVGAHKIPVEADLLFSEVDVDHAAMLVLPGGAPGTNNLESHEELLNAILDFHKKGKKIAAICAAPSILANLGILDGIQATCHPNFEDRIKAKGVKFSYDQVVISDNIITSRGLGTAIPFSLAIISELMDKETSDKIKKAIVY